MRFLPFGPAGRPGLAVVVDGEAVDLATLDRALPSELDDVMAGGAELMDRIAAALSAGKGKRVAPDTLRPRYPIARPANIVCLGLNYADHAKEGGHDTPAYPGLFLRMRNSVVASGAPLVRPRVSERFDYEAELMVVIGREGRAIPEANALDHVFGYTVFNDVSVRDFQRKSTQWTAGKNFDRAGAVGPVVVTADELPPGASGLRIQTRLNGEVMQDSNTANMIFPVARTIAILSEFATLSPGDMIAMGTPSGVGYARNPPVFMRHGDTVEVEIEGIGVLSNPVVDEDEAAMGAAAE